MVARSPFEVLSGFDEGATRLKVSASSRGATLAGGFSPSWATDDIIIFGASETACTGARGSAFGPSRPPG
ncbi:MAG: hypothetical protein ACLU7D_07300 [Collinsella sp.]